MFLELKSFFSRPWLWLLVVMLVSLAIIYAIDFLPSLYIVFPAHIFLTIHTVIELLSVIAGLQIFIFSWATHRQAQNPRMLLIGLAFLGVALIDIFHTFTYAGMPGLLMSAGTPRAAYFWIWGRLMAVGAILAASFVPTIYTPPSRVPRFLSASILLIVNLTVVGLVVIFAAFFDQYIPSLYIPGVGLSPLKIGLEYLVMALGLAAFFSYRRLYIKEQEDSILYLMVGLILTVIGEMCFTLYVNAYDIYNLLGHIYKFAAYGLFFYALFISQIRQPYNLLERTHRSLAESEHRFRSLVENVELAIMELDPQGSITYINPFLLSLSGYRPAEVLGKNWFTTFLKDEDRWWEQEIFNKAFGNGLPANFESRLLTREGEERYIAWNRIVLKNNRGEFVRAVCVGEDITERRRAEQALRESEKRYHRIVETSGEGIWEIDQNNQTAFVNPRMAEMLGYTVEEMIGRSLFEFMDPEARIIAEDKIERRRRGIGEQHDFRFRRKDGADLWALISTKPILSSEGNYLGALGMIIDITERKLAEESLRKSEQECRLLSSQLLMAEEKERKRIAQELHDGIGQYLSAIKFRVENFLKKMDEPSDQQTLQPLTALVPMVQEAVEEVRRICMDLRPSILDDLGILATIAWFCREFQNIYPGILVEQEIKLEEQEVPVELKTVIYRVLQEALNNIAKHSQAKQARLSLWKAGGSLNLVIEDDGQGFSLEEALSRESSKRGMGLGGMRERVELSGGTFTIESARGKGTKVQAAWKV